MEIHESIKLLRLKKNYTQNYMADELGIDVTNYSRLERGETTISVKRLEKIASILETNGSKLLSKEEVEGNQLAILKEILIEVKAIHSSIKKVE